MKVTLKVRFNASSEKFEKFNNGMYLVYIPFEQDAQSANLLKELISRKLGIPMNRVSFEGISSVTKNWIFEI
ncbi:hypothetical protein J4408_02800 [Candidatus Pacearchaeota archaeon]|nr:hypothetical protein [Candidatus Pacearchaeota archaeon]